MSCLWIIEQCNIQSLRTYLAQRDHHKTLLKTEPELCPLACALWRGNVDVIKMIMDTGVDVNWRYNDGTTPFVRALDRKITVIIDIMLGMGPNMDIKTTWGSRVLLAATQAGRADLVRHMLELSRQDQLSRPDQYIRPNPHKNGALVIAAAHGRCDLVQLLFDYGVSANSVNTAHASGMWPETAMIAASMHGHTDIIDMLVAAGADINVVDSKHQSALFYAVKHGRLQAAQLLIGYGARTNGHGKDNSDTAPLNEIVTSHRNGYMSPLIKPLVQAGADVELVDDNGNSLLMRSICRNIEDYLDNIKELLEAGANVNVINSHGQTALGTAIYVGQPRTVQALLAAGANVNAKDTHGTMVSVAAVSTTPSFLLWILQAGATVTPADVERAPNRLKTALTVVATSRVSRFGMMTLLQRSLQYVRCHRHVLVANDAELHRRLPQELVDEVLRNNVVYPTTKAWQQFVHDVLTLHPIKNSRFYPPTGAWQQFVHDALTSHPLTSHPSPSDPSPSHSSPSHPSPSHSSPSHSSPSHSSPSHPSPSHSSPSHSSPSHRSTVHRPHRRTVHRRGR